MENHLYVLVYQNSIANVFEVDTFECYPLRFTPEWRNAKRILQNSFTKCEGFCEGLKLAGGFVMTMACDKVGDITNEEWSFCLDNKPFYYSMHPVYNTEGWNK